MQLGTACCMPAAMDLVFTAIALQEQAGLLFRYTVIRVDLLTIATHCCTQAHSARAALQARLELVCHEGPLGRGVSALFQD